MENKNKILISDLKLQAFLRVMLPEAFIGINRDDSKKVNFVFKKDQKLSDLVKGYFSGEKYSLSPQMFANYIDQGKDFIFGNIEI